jgi:leucyl aminopeptidase
MLFKNLFMNIQFTNVLSNPYQGVDTIVLGVAENLQLSGFSQTLDRSLGGSVQRAIQASRFKGKNSQTLLLFSPSPEVQRILLVGIGKPDQWTRFDLEKIGAKVTETLENLPSKNIFVIVDETGPSLRQSIVGSYIASGMRLRSFQFTYQTTQEEPKTVFDSVKFFSSDPADSEKSFLPLQAIAEGSFLARLVGNEPPNIMDPETLAQKAKEEVKPLGVQVEILDGKDLKKAGMNALLAVAQGSQKDPQLVILQWKGGPTSQAPIAVVGKGVTFDSGGINLKPSANMEDMKYDMCGAGTVLGLMKSLALRKAPVNVVGVMGLVENMPSGSAQRPSDIIKSLSGQTIEVLNTDAEGRLVLADALWYTQDRFKPQVMIDLATLTGAIVVALGHEHAGLFSNQDELADRLFHAGKQTGERIWRFPMDEVYAKDIKSDLADVKNVGSNRGAGSITAAQFLEKFVNKVPWAHLDIAGVAWEIQKSKPLTGRWATGFGVRLLNQFLKDYYESV